MMNIEDIQETLDQLYKESLDLAYEYMMKMAMQAMQDQNDEILFFILNELIGYYRVTSKKEEGEKIADQLIHLLYARNLENSIAAATSYLNIATMYRAFDKTEPALKLYQLTDKIYEQLPENDIRRSAFYNNYSLLYLQLKEYHQAIALAEKALAIVAANENHAEEAVSCVNLAQMYLAVNRIDEARALVERGIDLFHRYTEKDSHYFSALAALAQCHYRRNEYDQAVVLYEEAIAGVERVYGRNKDYETLTANRDQILALSKQRKGLELCRRYYETFGKKMIEEKFKDEKPYMAVGMFGFGSDCLGYDDEISQDHDFGGGFCILLPEHIYQKIGKDLQEAYDQLPEEFDGIRRMTSFHGQGRVGVFEINAFFEQFLQQIPQTLSQWLYADENALLNCTNGMIFADHYGEVTRIREYLHYYPEDVRIKKIVRAIAKMAQSGQYNYARCMKRGQIVAASMALHEFVDQTLSLIYLFNRKYKPYYKWSFYGLKDCTILYDIKDSLEQLVLLPCQQDKWHRDSDPVNLDDPKIRIIEYICQRVIEQLKAEGLTTLDHDFLEDHTQEVMNHIKDPVIRSKHIMEG